MPYMDFNEAFAKRRMQEILKIDTSPSVIIKNNTGDRTMEPFDGKTSAERKVEEIAKRSLGAGEHATIEKARAAAWLADPALYDQHNEESHSEAFLAKVAKASEAKIAKSGHAMSSAETKLDDLAQKRARETGESFIKAYTAILDTEEGRRLYAEHRAA